MTLYHNKYRVETTRLKGWDYTSDGYYFVTICTHNREHLLGHIQHGKMILNPCGQMVENGWFDLPNHYPNIRLDAFCVMPNHIHGIIVIDNTTTNVVETGFKPVSNISSGELIETGFKPVSTGALSTDPSSAKRHGLFEMVRALKTFSARRINELRNTPGQPVWQSRFHDHIVRNDAALQRIRQYIANNPQTWDNDMFNRC